MDALQESDMITIADILQNGKSFLSKSERSKTILEKYVDISLFCIYADIDKDFINDGVIRFIFAKEPLWKFYFIAMAAYVSPI